MLDKNLVSQIQKVLAKEPGIISAYVFGSIVSGFSRASSDFDIAFVVNNKKRVDENYIYELMKDIHFPKDLDISVVDKSSSPLFLYQIVSNGKRVYAKDSSLAEEFEANILHCYYDTSHIRNIYQYYLRDKFPKTYAN